MVYGLRYYFRLLGMNKKAIALPSLKKDTKLPVILNRSELKELFSAPTLLKQRIVLSLIYSAGLRGQEVINLKISDARFIAKDYRDRGRQKPVSLTGAEFLGRFCQHAGIAEILPLSADSIPAAGS